MQNAIQMTARLYEARDSMRTLLADRYQERIQPFTTAIRQLASHQNITELAAATRIAKDANEQGKTVTAVLVLAAYVEMVEPSPNPTALAQTCP